MADEKDQTSSSTDKKAGGKSTAQADGKAAKKVETKKVKGLRVTPKRDGFRRGGREWHGTTEVAISEFSKKQFKQIRDESMLVVQNIDINVTA